MWDEIRDCSYCRPWDCPVVCTCFPPGYGCVVHAIGPSIFGVQGPPETEEKSVLELRDEVQAFAASMERKLQEVRSEADEDGQVFRDNSWKSESIGWLHDRLVGEGNELTKAMADCDPDDVMAEAVDVANFAMFIWWKLAKRRGDV